MPSSVITYEIRQSLDVHGKEMESRDMSLNANSPTSVRKHSFQKVMFVKKHFIHSKDNEYLLCSKHYILVGERQIKHSAN